MGRVRFHFVLALGLLSACKNDRERLEQLVPDGATAIVSVDAKAMLAGELKTQLDAVMLGLSLAAKSTPAADALVRLRDDCKLDPWTLESLVVGIDAFSQSVVVAVRMPNIGTADALGCVAALVEEKQGESFTVGEADGKPTVAFADKTEGWALDGDTLVVSSKAWATAVKGRVAGDGKAAVDHGLAEAIALADKSRHLWFAGEVPSLVAPMLDETPAKGLRRAAGSVQYGKQLELAIAGAFADEAAATAMHDTARKMLDAAKAAGASDPATKALLDGASLERDGVVVRGKLVVDLQPIIDQSVSSFTSYMSKAKTSEAAMNTSRLFDAVAVAAVEHGTCPTDGRDSGETGITPPLTVDCSAGLSGNCAAVANPSGPGEYAASLWTDSPLWHQLQFEQSLPHRFHYNYKWTKAPGGCEFTVQAFGDLDGDHTYSTFERSGSVGPEGTNAGAAGLVEHDPAE